MTRGTSHAFSVRLPLAVGLAAVTLLLGGFGTWAALTEISGAVVAPGRIAVERNRQVVQHPDGGVVAEIAVAEGDSVAAGQMLLRLDASEKQSRKAIIEGQLYELMARRARLEAERDDRAAPRFDPLLRDAAETDADARAVMEGQARLLEARRLSVAQEREQLSRRRAQIRDQISGIEAQQTALGEQLSLIERELEDQQSLLDRGLAQASRVLNLRRERARLTGQMGELTAQKARAEGRITEIELEMLKLDSRRREEAITRLRDLQARELELRETRRALIEQLDRLDIRAPVSGIVYGLQVHTPRAVLRPAEPVLYLVPQDRPLIIRARIRPTEIDRVYPGQRVLLRLTALDRRNTPELAGRVSQVSADTFEDERTGRAYYRARIVMVPGEQEKLPDGAALIPGMPVETFIRTADRTPLAYLVKPLADYFSRAFRE